MEIQQNPSCSNIQFIAKILEKAPLKSPKKKRSVSSLSKSKSRSTSRSKSKSKEPNRTTTTSTTSLIPKATEYGITIRKKLSKGNENFIFDKTFDKLQNIQTMYKQALQPLVHSLVFENKNLSIIHFGSQKSKKKLWLYDVNSVNDGLYGKLVDEIFDKITLKNKQNGDGQLITVKMSFYEVTNFQENIIDLLNDQSPYQNIESMIVTYEIFDLDDFLEMIQYIEENNLFSITEKQGKTQICKIRLSGGNTNSEINFINLEDDLNKDREEYYYGFFKEIRDSQIYEMSQIKNTKNDNFSRLTQTLQSCFDQNSAVVVLSSFVSDSKDHLLNLSNLKFSKRVQNVFRFYDESQLQTKIQSGLTTNYNTNNPELSQIHMNMGSGSINNLHQSGINQYQSGSSNNLMTNYNSAVIKNLVGTNEQNIQSSPQKSALYSHLTSNYQTNDPYNEDQQCPQFGQKSTNRRSYNSMQFNEANKNMLNNDSLFNSNQPRNPQVESINQEIDEVNQSILNPPISTSSFFTQWMKNKTEFIENILVNISSNRNIDGDTKNILLDKVLSIKSQLQQINETSNNSPTSQQERIQRQSNKASSSSDLKQQREKMFEYFETPRFELEGRKKMADQRRVTLTENDQRRISSASSQIKGVIKSPSSKNVSQMDISPIQKTTDTFGNYYCNMKPLYPQKPIHNEIQSEGELSDDSMEDQIKKIVKKKGSKTINFKGTKKGADKKTKSDSKSTSLAKRKGSTSRNKDLNTSQGNLSVLSKKSTQSRKSIGSRKSVTSQKSVKSTASKKSVTSKKSATSKKSSVSASSKQKKPKLTSGIGLSDRRKSSTNLIKKVTPLSQRESQNLGTGYRQSLLKSSKSPRSLNRSKESYGDNSMQYTKQDQRYTREDILQDLDIRQLRSENSPNQSVNSRKASINKSPKFTTSQQYPQQRGRTLSNDYYQTNSGNESQNESYQNLAQVYDSNPQNFTNSKIKDHLKQNQQQQLQQMNSFSQLPQDANLNNRNSIINNQTQNQQPVANINSQQQIRQNIKQHLKKFRDLVDSSSSESDYDLHYQISNIQPSMPLRKSYKFQSKVKEFDLNFETEKKFLIEQQGKSEQTDLLKNYHKLLLKSYDIQKLLDEQVNINDELQKEVFTQEEKFNILQRKHLKKKKEKKIIKQEMDDKLLEFEKMEQRDSQSRLQLQQQSQKLLNLQIQCEQQEKIIKNLENQLDNQKSSYESRILEVEEVSDNQKIQLEKLNDIISRNQQTEMDLRSQYNSKTQQFDHDIKNKREEFERQLAINQLTIKQVQTQKYVDLQSYDKKLNEASDEVERLQIQLMQMKQKYDVNQKILKQNEETINSQRKEKAELDDRIEELQNENQHLKSDKMILQHKNSSIMQQTIQQRIESEKNMKNIEQNLPFYKSKQNLQKEQEATNSYRQEIEQESRLQRKLETPQHNQHLSTQFQTTHPSTLYQNMNQSAYALQNTSNNQMSNLQQGYLTSSPNQQTSNNNQNISVSAYDVANSAREIKSDRNSQSPQQESRQNLPQPQQQLQQQQQQQMRREPSQQNINLNDFLNTPSSIKVPKKGKDGKKTKRITRESSTDKEQLISTQRDNKKKLQSSSLTKSKNPQTARITAAPKLKKK